MAPAVEEAADNGIYEYEENSLSIASEDIDDPTMENFDSPPENDFAEYMWMENEEEFDKEVMQRLEEEALMEECIAFMSSESDTSEESMDPNAVTNSKLNPEAAEFVPSNRIGPSLEDIPDLTDSL